MISSLLDSFGRNAISLYLNQLLCVGGQSFRRILNGE